MYMLPSPPQSHATPGPADGPMPGSGGGPLRFLWPLTPTTGPLDPPRHHSGGGANGSSTFIDIVGFRGVLTYAAVLMRTMG